MAETASFCHCCSDCHHKSVFGVPTLYPDESLDSEEPHETCLLQIRSKLHLGRGLKCNCYLISTDVCQSGGLNHWNRISKSFAPQRDTQWWRQIQSDGRVHNAKFVWCHMSLPDLYRNLICSGPIPWPMGCPVHNHSILMPSPDIFTHVEQIGFPVQIGQRPDRGVLQCDFTAQLLARQNDAPPVLESQVTSVAT